jgi:hypothetical protein
VRIDKKPDKDEAVVVEVVSINDEAVTLNVRIRANNSWLYYRGVRLTEGHSFIVNDNKSKETETTDKPGIDIIEVLPHDLLDYLVICQQIK